MFNNQEFIKFVPKTELNNSFTAVSVHELTVTGAIKLTNLGCTSNLILRPLVRLVSIFRFILLRRLCNLIHFLEKKIELRI